MIIGISGFARSGKDTVANFLVEKHGFTKLSFADPIREALIRLNPNVDVLGTPGVPLSSVLPSMGWENLKDASSQVRGLLQRMGTEVGREMFGENFWVDYAMKTIQELDTDVVIPDVRFLNEVYAIRSWNGMVWKVSRPEVTAVNSHKSETELSSFTGYDVIIENTSTKEDLFSELTPLVESLRVHNGY